MKTKQERDQERKEKAEYEYAKERMYVEELLKSAAGRWLLSRIYARFEQQLERRNVGHNSEDSYNRGIQDAMREQSRDLIIKYFGHSGIDTLLKG